jgi:hypothetical protein
MWTKELYEPLFDEILKSSQANEFKIRGIWIADVAMQGQSGVLNEKTMGNDRKMLLFFCEVFFAN